MDMQYTKAGKQRARGRLPHGYWTLERCREVAALYNTRVEFKKGPHSAARFAAQKAGWMDEICGHMVRPPSHNLKWTLETLAPQALKYTTRTEFRDAQLGAYTAACRLGIMDDICGHMVSGGNGVTVKWTFERCQAEALKYTTRAAFRTGDKFAWQSARAKGWMDDICGHMTHLRPVRTDDEIAAEALNYSSRQAFKDGSGAYQVAVKRGIIGDICNHMEYLPSGFKKDKPAILYYYEINGLYKLGITNLTVRKRVGAQYKDIRVLARKRFKIGGDAADAERAIRNYVDDCHRYDGPPVLTNNGDTELYTCDILGLDT